ncbi:MAG: hypothetical protein Q8P13_01070 [bacterium]|nr:hypothetical protein [bacterium]
MDTAQNQDQPTPVFPKPAFLTDQKEAENQNPPTETAVAANPPQPETPNPVPSSDSSGDYGKKLAEELAKLDKIYQGQFTGSIPTKDGSSNAIFLKEPPIDTPEFLKESHEQQIKAVEEAGLVGLVPGNSLISVKGEAASRLYKYLHAEDKKTFGESFETSIGTISYKYEKPELKSLADLVGDNDPDSLADVSPWNQATKTTAEIAEMKKFVLREERIEEVLKAAYETTSKLAEKAA